MNNINYEYGINSNTYKLLFSDFKDIPIDEQGTEENLIAYVTIDQFTKLQQKYIFQKLLKYLFKKTAADLNKITYSKETKQYEYKHNDLIITFDKISNYFEDKSLIKELTSDERYHQCHTRSIHISPSIRDSKIVTGYITIRNEKCLHSVIEYNYKNETIILDWTLNLVITKEQYIKLTKFVELSSFYGQYIIDDFEIMIENLDIDSKPYVVFRDELIKDMKKNPHIFKPSEEIRSTLQTIYNNQNTEKVLKKTK